MVEALQSDIKKTGEGFKSFVGDAVAGMLKIGAAVIGASAAMAIMQSKQLATANRANISSAAFTNFSLTIKSLQGDSEQFINSMSEMQKTFDNLAPNSQPFQELAKNLALLSIYSKDKSLDITKLQGLDQTGRVMALASAIEKSKPGKDRRESENIVDSIMPGLSNAVEQARVLGKSFAQVYNDQSAGRAVTGATMTGNAKNAYALSTVGNVGTQIIESGLEKVLTALRPSIEKISTYLINHEKDFDQFFTQVGKLLDGLMKVLGPIAEGVGGVAGGVVNAMFSAQSAAEYQSSPEGKKKQQEIRKTFASLPGGSVSPNEDAVQDWAIQMATKGKSLTEGITDKQVAEERGKVSNITISGNQMKFTDEQVKLIVAAKASGKLPAFMDDDKSAAQIVALALGMASKK
jgi:hypothetical protein